MKIAYIIPSLVRSGPIKVVHQLTEYLHKEHDIDVFYLEDRTDRELMTFSVPVNKISFKETIDFDHYDIVHSHSMMPDLYIRWHADKMKQCKRVTTIHNYAYEDLPAAYGALKGYVMAMAWGIGLLKHDMQVVLSKHAKSYYEKIWWPNKRMIVVYNGVEGEVPTLPKNKEKVDQTIKIGNIASAGGINVRKGIDQIVKALAFLPENHELYIAGKETAEVNVLKALAQKHHVEHRIHFLGYVSDMHAFINEMDLFVVASRSEGFPLSLQEIVQHKKSVVCSNLPLFQEIFDSNEVTFFTLEKSEELANAIKYAYQHRDTLAQKAYKRYREHYTADIMAKNYEKVYSQLI